MASISKLRRICGLTQIGWYSRQIAKAKRGSLCLQNWAKNIGRQFAPKEAIILGLFQSGEQEMTKNKSITADEFDKIFDDGKESILPFLDKSTIARGEDLPRRANVDFPQWMLKALDREAKRIGIARQALIKIWIAERLKEIDKAA
jgi:hypothetical protein